MGLTKVNRQLLDGITPINILDYIPITEQPAILAGTSTYDCSTDITTAINALLGTTKAKALYFPKGTYVIGAQITLSSLTGFKFSGDGTGASILKYTPDTAAMFYITNYVNLLFNNLGFTTSSTAQTNVCFRLNGTGGGTELTFDECSFDYFGKAFTTVDAVGNDDTNSFNNCAFRYNKYVWDNTNSQAVSWTFNQCQVLYTTGTVFNNPGGFLQVYGGTYINQGTFCNVSQPAAVYGLQFNGLKFETTQNFVPPGTPKWLTIGGSSAVEAYFTRCNDNGGGAYSGQTFLLKNIFDITFDECTFSNGYMTIQANALDPATNYCGSITANSSILPEIQETTYPGTGGIPSAKFFYNSSITNGTSVGYFTGSANRLYGTQDVGNPVTATRQKLFMYEAIGAVTKGFNFYIPIPQNGIFTISNLDFLYQDSSTNTATITLYTDSTKTTTIYSYSKAGTSGFKYATATLATLSNVYTMTDLSADLYVEVVPAGDIGTPRISFVLDFTPFY